ncbi:hypothetical protein P3S68_029998 [Capsicum galapagoense]
MKFDSDEHAYECYNEYATSIGFSVRKEYANKNRVQGYVTSTKFTCYKEGIRPKASFEYAARQAGGQFFLGYTKGDHKNYLRDKRQESLKRGFDDSLITNVFWVDAKMIRDFKIYGDVVSFDTTYRTNREYRPLALFVDLNNHREMVIFGATLLYEESTGSFE